LFSGSGTHDLQPRCRKCLLDLLNPARRLPEKKLSKTAIRRSEVGGL
jgi:hypothetical protein